MLKPMPNNLIKVHNNMNNIELDNFFGFAKCEIITPSNILKPILPYKDYKNGRTIYPIGKWIGTYFSEELKAITKLGYKIKLLKGYEFDKVNLFNDYINHFYNIKKYSPKDSPQRFIAKMHLNTLYGIFGRKLDMIQTINVYNKDLFLYISTKFIKSIITINDEISTLLIQNNLNLDLIKDLNLMIDSNFTSFELQIKSNVAIASAVTSYSRIHMIPFILHPGTVYTDTDSIFTETELPNNLISKELGYMKDELDGLFIEEAYFLDIKKYGYYYFDNNNKIECSIISGVPRNTIPFNDIIKLAKGDILTKDLPNRFFKSFKDLNINIKTTKLTIKQTNNKTIINNIYHPYIINKQNIKNVNNFLQINKFVSKIILNFKKDINFYIFYFIKPLFLSIPFNTISLYRLIYITDI